MPVFLPREFRRGARWATVHGVLKSATRLSDFSLSPLIFFFFRFLPSNLVILFLGHTPSGRQELSSPPGIKPRPPASEAQSLNCRTAREVPLVILTLSELENP